VEVEVEVAHRCPCKEKIAMPARENCQANREVRINMSITGIGATIVPSAAGGFEISSLSPNGTARAHLLVGDRIMSIGSVATSGKSDGEVKALILGPAGSTISMVFTHTACTLPPHLTAANFQVVARGPNAMHMTISFIRNLAPGAVPAAPAPAPAPAPAASTRPALGLTLVPAQAGSGDKVASVTPQGLAATTGRPTPRPTQSPV
jgi:hypothetical protein